MRRKRRIRHSSTQFVVAATAAKGWKKKCSIKENNKWRRFQQVVDVQHIHNTDGPANNNNETRNNNRPSPYYITFALLFVYNVLIILKEKRQNVQQSVPIISIEGIQFEFLSFIQVQLFNFNSEKYSDTPKLNFFYFLCFINFLHFSRFQIIIFNKKKMFFLNFLFIYLNTDIPSLKSFYNY